MRRTTAEALFAADVAQLRDATGHHRIGNLTLLSPLRATFQVRLTGKIYTLVANASPHYPLVPTELLFCGPGNPNDTTLKWWPPGGNALGPADGLICIMGVAAGHKAHSPWPIQTRKNRLEAIVSTLTSQLLKADPWIEVPA